MLPVYEWQTTSKKSCGLNGNILLRHSLQNISVVQMLQTYHDDLSDGMSDFIIWGEPVSRKYS